MRLLLTLSLVLPSAALSWGFDGHRKLASMMQDPLPANSCLRQWFQARQTPALQDSACDPDRWRYPSAGTLYDPNEAPRHFLEVDWMMPAAAYPRDFAAAQARFGNYAVSNGIVPWRVEDKYLELVADFRAKDTAKILTGAFVLSHYVTDSFSVLHDTKNFDPNGLHGRWESDMLNPTANLVGVSTLALTYIGTPGRADPRNNIFDIALVGNGLLPDLVGFDLAGDAGIQELYNSSRDLTARRWGDALTLLSSILWTAWVEAGSPELAGFTAGCSRAVPTTDVSLRGYPVPGGFTHPGRDGGFAGFDAGPTGPDAGLPDAGIGDDAGAPDASQMDSGSGGTDAGSGTGGSGPSYGGGIGFIGGGFGGGGGGGRPKPTSCECSSADGLIGALALLALSRRRA